MKNVIWLIVIAIYVSSCCSTKQVHSKEKEKIAQAVPIKVEETPQVPKIIIEEEVVQPEPEVLETELPKPPSTLETVEVEVIDQYAPEVFDHGVWNTLLQKNVTEAGNVNYKTFKSDRATLSNYIKSLSENMPNKSWNEEDKLAYWMNAYNAMTVDLIIRNYPIKSIKDIKKPWDQRLWKLGKKWYNLNEIEHQILRKMNEPRIHFGIVCASFSCPKLQNEAFTSSQLEKQLTKATEEFLSDNKRNNITPDRIKLSKIFQWFAKDFKQNGSLIDFLNKYSDISISSDAKKSFKDYNWDLND